MGVGASGRHVGESANLEGGSTIVYYGLLCSLYLSSEAWVLVWELLGSRGLREMVWLRAFLQDSYRSITEHSCIPLKKADMWGPLDTVASRPQWSVLKEKRDFQTKGQGQQEWANGPQLAGVADGTLDGEARGPSRRSWGLPGDGRGWYLPLSFPALLSVCPF